jgi:uroporphyrinogen decarboxylase
LCLIKYDDEELYAKLFSKMGEVINTIWREFIENFGDTYCVMRFGDDLGFRSSTLLPPEDIKAHIIPVYKQVIAQVHTAGKPFLLHTCGNNFSIMDDLINAGINAKHSNEDAIAPFSRWVETYGDKIALFGGIDTDILVREDEKTISEQVQELCRYMYNKDKGACRCGFALGSGNSIPDYVPPEKYMAMNRAVRAFNREMIK